MGLGPPPTKTPASVTVFFCCGSVGLEGCAASGGPACGGLMGAPLTFPFRGEEPSLSLAPPPASCQVSCMFMQLSSRCK